MTKEHKKVRPDPGQTKVVARYLLGFLGVLLCARGFCNASSSLLGALFHALGKALNASAGVHEVLAAGIKRVTVRANGYV